MGNGEIRVRRGGNAGIGRLTAVCLTVSCLLCGCALKGVETGPADGESVPAETALGTEAHTETEAETEPEAETEAEPSHGGVLIGENQELLTKEQMEAVFAYMDRFYEAMGSLEMKELSDLFAESAAGQTAFHRNAWEYMIGLRSMQETDLRLDEYFYRLWIIEAETLEDGSVDVDMGEQSFLRFAQTPDMVSEYPGYWHDFVLTEENGRWVIREHMQWEGAFWNMRKGYRDTDLEELSDAEQIFADRRDLLLRQAADDLERRRALKEAGGADSADAEEQKPAHSYDRSAAVAYARQYMDERNEDWHDYSGEGGNCQNYVSQCILAGGIPMDVEGSARWKWFSAAQNDSASETGCTLSWINVDSFWAYARDNTGSGLVAEVDADFDSGQAGDLIVMGTPDDWNHVVIITEVVKDAEGNTVDYLICSNTTDVRDFPVSAYPSPRRALIRILGWN